MKYGAEGIGLCRTEHMFFDPDRIPKIPSDDPGEDAGTERKSA